MRVEPVLLLSLPPSSPLPTVGKKQKVRLDLKASPSSLPLSSNPLQTLPLLFSSSSPIADRDVDLPLQTPQGEKVEEKQQQQRRSLLLFGSTRRLHFRRIPFHSHHHNNASLSASVLLWLARRRTEGWSRGAVGQHGHEVSILWVEFGKEKELAKREEGRKSSRF